jgi:dipeptidyl aminopeptidase/acylaminoacyl peptidase
MYALPDPFYQETAPVHTDMYIESQYAAAPLLAPDHKDRSAIYTHARQQGRWNQVVAGLDPASDFMKLLTYCPVRMMTCDMPPTFIIHGRADTDVSYDQAAQTAAALQSMGVEHRFISLDCGHGVYGDGADEAMRGSADFLDRHTSIT